MVLQSDPLSIQNALYIIVTISFIIVISPFFAKITKLPTTVIEILLGSITAHYTLLVSNDIFNLIAKVGFFYLMFLAGAEVDMRILLKLEKKIVKYGLIYILFLYLFSIFFTLLFNLNGVFIVIMPLISVGLILTLFKEYGKEENWLNFAMTIGILGELISIVVLTVTEASLKHGVGIELYTTLLYLITFLATLILIYKSLKVLFCWYPELKLF